MMSEGTPRREAGRPPTGGQAVGRGATGCFPFGVASWPAGPHLIAVPARLPFGLCASRPHVAIAQDRGFLVKGKQ